MVVARTVGAFGIDPDPAAEQDRGVEAVAGRGHVGLREEPLCHRELGDRPVQTPAAQLFEEVELLQGQDVRPKRPEEIHLPSPPVSRTEPGVRVPDEQRVEGNDP
ncbi:hypothetical protein [Streptomyces sp. NPDC054975]